MSSRQAHRWTKASLSALVLSALAVSVAVSPAHAEVRYGQTNHPGTTVVGHLWQYHDEQGDELVLTASGSCTPETGGAPDYYVTNLANDPYDSNNGTSSFQDYASCDTKLFNGTDGTGTSYGYYNGGSAGMNINGSFDNTASSVQYD